MRILLTNDDGMNASQLIPLIRACRKWGEVTAVVPKVEQSGMSHAIEIHKAFEVKEISLAPDITVYAVDSTPADCVRFAILGLKNEFDLVISGINRGFNIGTDIQYSGTVGAALDAAHQGVNALAMSTSPDYYDQAVAHLDEVLTYITENRLFDTNNVFNVNIPPNPKEILITRQGGIYFSDKFPCIGEDMYMPTGICLHKDEGDLTKDTDAVLHGYLSITPLTTVKTNHEAYAKLRQLNRT